MKVNITDIPEDKTFTDYPSNTEFVHQECFLRYVLHPFEIIFPSDPRYETAMTKTELKAYMQNHES